MLAFARALGVEPREVAVVGDAVHDLVAARAAGAVAVGVLSGPTPRELLAPHADALLDSIADLPVWLTARATSLMAPASIRAAASRAQPRDSPLRAATRR